MMRTFTLAAAVVLLGALSAPSSAMPIAASGARGQTSTAVDTVLARRCPPGYRRTIGGCMRKRPTWWSALVGR